MRGERASVQENLARSRFQPADEPSDITIVLARMRKAGRLAPEPFRAPEEPLRTPSERNDVSHAWEKTPHRRGWERSGVPPDLPDSLTGNPSGSLRLESLADDLHGRPGRELRPDFIESPH